MRRLIGMNLHRTFAEVMIWEKGRLRYQRRIDMTRNALEGFDKSSQPTDGVVIEAAGSYIAVSRVLSPVVAQVIIVRRASGRQATG